MPPMGLQIWFGSLIFLKCLEMITQRQKYDADGLAEPSLPRAGATDATPRWLNPSAQQGTRRGGDQGLGD